MNRTKRRRKQKKLDEEPSPFKQILLEDGGCRRTVDRACWICHEESLEQVCKDCPRVFHTRCLDPKVPFTENGICPECQLESLDGTELPPMLKLGLFNCLPLVFNDVALNYQMFRYWTGDNYHHCRNAGVMNLEDIKLRISSKYYRMKPTVAFLGDIKRIHHYCHALYGSLDPLTVVATWLVNSCKSRLQDFEACPICHVKSIYSAHVGFVINCSEHKSKRQRVLPSTSESRLRKVPEVINSTAKFEHSDSELNRKNAEPVSIINSVGATQQEPSGSRKNSGGSEMIPDEDRGERIPLHKSHNSLVKAMDRLQKARQLKYFNWHYRIMSFGEYLNHVLTTAYSENIKYVLPSPFLPSPLR